MPRIHWGSLIVGIAAAFVVSYVLSHRNRI